MIKLLILIIILAAGYGLYRLWGVAAARKRREERLEREATRDEVWEQMLRDGEARDRADHADD